MQMPADCTFYVRLSLMVPKRGYADRVRELNDDLLDFFSTQPGYVRGYRLTGAEPGGQVGRLTVWLSEREADQTATTQQVLSRRSELLQIIEEDSHVERSFSAYDPQLAKTAAS